MRGASQLKIYGPMAGHMLDVVLKALGSNLASAYDGMKTSQDVNGVFKIAY